ncbi:hypothetical protein ACFLTJ_00485 [Chloroflexota bacterium]
MDVKPQSSGSVEIDGDAPSSYPNVITLDDGDYITLEAVPVAGYQFVEWDGPSSGMKDDNPLRMQIVRTTTITANFTADYSQFSSADGKLDLVINDGTTALDDTGGPLTNVEFVVVENPPAANGSSIIGRAYDLGPDGATFSPGAVLRWDYETEYIPEGIEHTELVIAYHDGVTGQWIALTSAVDLEDTVIETTIQHLTTFAILAPGIAPIIPETVGATFTTSNLNISPGEVNPGGEVSISVLLTNTGEESASSIVALNIDGALEDTKQETMAGGESKVVTFTTSREAAGTYQVDVNGLSGYAFTVTEGEIPLPPPAPQIEPPASAPEPPAPTPSSLLSGINWAIALPILIAIFLAIFLPLKLRRRGESLDW